MSEEKKHIIYTAADIQKYLTGQMNNAEMHAVEKAAMNDPLLAEAIEGYEAMEQKDWSSELALLKEQLTAKENKPIAPVYSLRKWWRAAAAIIVIGSGIAITYVFSNKNKKELTNTAGGTASNAVIANADTVNLNKDIAANDIVRKSDSAQLSLKVTENTSRKKTFSLFEATKNNKRYDSGFVYTPSASAPANTKDIATSGATNDDLHEEQSASNNLLGNESVSNQVSSEPANKVRSAQNQANISGNNFITAQVVTEDNKPVGFANVNIQKTKQTLYTDSKGIFKLPVADSSSNIVVTSAGYIPKKINLKNSIADNKIVLQEDTIDLTAVSTNKARSLSKPQLKKEIENEEVDEDAVPSVGWTEYNSYINNNLVFPDEAREKNIHGEVEVFVKLKNNGDISEIKVNKPLCASCDAEAVRLVKEGPKWDVKNKKAKKAKIKIRF